MSALPPDFWEEFDRRLDAKLDAKLGARLKPLEAKIDNLINWTQRQDKMIELEITRALRSHLEEQFRGYYTVFPSVIPSRITDERGLEITEFDGVLILTNNMNVVRLVAPPKGTRRSGVVLPPKEVFQPGVIAHIVIVEAKQNLTLAKWRRKMEQRAHIERIIRDCRANPDATPNGFRHIGLQYFEPSVGLYIGGQEVSETFKDSVREAIDRQKNTDIRPIMMGWLELNGARFSVNDEQNDYGAAAFKGGAKSKPVRKYFTSTMYK